MGTRQNEKNSAQSKQLVVRKKAVAEMLGVGKATISDWCNPSSPRFNPSFPRPRKLGAATVVWLISELESWLASDATQN